MITSTQMKALEDFSEAQGISTLELMENAGREFAAAVKKKYDLNGKRIVIFCGTGNNAGDGFVIGRHLLNAQIPTQIFLIGQPSRLKQDVYINYRILKNVGVPIHKITAVNDFVWKTICRSTLIIDAIFGVGLNRNIEDPFYTVIDYLNRSKKLIVSVDIPSGLDGTTGKIFGICVKAKLTVTFSWPKKGFYYNEGPKYSGRIKVVDIGIPKPLMKKI